MIYSVSFLLLMSFSSCKILRDATPKSFVILDGKPRLISRICAGLCSDRLRTWEGYLNLRTCLLASVLL
jgi:hypothetical protein